MRHPVGGDGFLGDAAGRRAARVPRGGEPFFNPRHRAWWAKPRVAEIAAAYEAAFTAARDPDKLREHALAYDADKVFAEYWVPVMAALEAGLGQKALEPAS